MKKLISTLAACLFLGSAIALSACVQIVDPAQLYSSFMNQQQSSQTDSSSVEEDVKYNKVSTLAAFNIALSEGLNVQLTADIELTPAAGKEDENAAVIIPEGKTIYIDLNGNNLTVPEKTAGRHYYVFDNYGSLNLRGSGTLKGRGVENFGELTIRDEVTIQAIDKNGGAAVWNEGALYMNGGKLEALYKGSSSDSIGPGCLNNFGTAVIDGGTLQSNSFRTYAIISSGTLTINNANVIATHGAIAIDDGTLTIENGSIYASQHYALYLTKGAITINGGLFAGGPIGNDNDIFIDSNEVTMLVTGGTLGHNKVYNKGTITLKKGAAFAPENVTNVESGSVVDDKRNVPDPLPEDSSVADSSTSVQDDSSVVQDNSSVAQDNSSVVQDNSSVATQNSSIAE